MLYVSLTLFLIISCISAHSETVFFYTAYKRPPPPPPLANKPKYNIEAKTDTT